MSAPTTAEVIFCSCLLIHANFIGNFNIAFVNKPPFIRKDTDLSVKFVRQFVREDLTFALRIKALLVQWKSERRLNGGQGQNRTADTGIFS
ncbi:MAG: hypothetical protein ACU84Q_07655, partial [Gammaproteobacteria bacterium]